MSALFATDFTHVSSVRLRLEATISCDFVCHLARERKTRNVKRRCVT